MSTICTSRVRATAFQKFFEDNPDSLLRMVQVRSPDSQATLCIVYYLFPPPPLSPLSPPCFSLPPPSFFSPSLFLSFSPLLSFPSPFSSQIIMLRLQRVTFMALNQFLGLGHELLNQVGQLQYIVCVGGLAAILSVLWNNGCFSLFAETCHDW